MKKHPSIVGGASIIASVCVGAGMLALPAAGAGAWTEWTIAAMLLTMVVMTVSGWLLLEVFQHYPLRVSFDTVTRDLLGKGINILNNLAVYFVGAILLYAYTTTAGGLVSQFTGWSNTLSSIVFVLVFSLLVRHSTRLVDRVSIVLVLFMVLSFLFGTSDLLRNVNLSILSGNGADSYIRYAPALLPVALTSFGYHHSVASMRIYYESERRAHLAILGGTLISLALYVAWIVGVFGNLPRSSFGPVLAAGGDVGVLINTLGGAVDSVRTGEIIRAFSVAAILSSFIGVGLGVFDFIADFFKIRNTFGGRNASWALTFLPPLAMSLLFPFGFVSAIGYAGAVATIWTCIVPALLLWRARKRFGVGEYRVPLGETAAWVVGIFGVVVAILHFMAMFKQLPVLG